VTAACDDENDVPQSTIHKNPHRLDQRQLSLPFGNTAGRKNDAAASCPPGLPNGCNAIIYHGVRIEMVHIDRPRDNDDTRPVHSMAARYEVGREGGRNDHGVAVEAGTAAEGGKQRAVHRRVQIRRQQSRARALQPTGDLCGHLQPERMDEVDALSADQFPHLPRDFRPR
jgi:hypothetical protein